MRTGTYILLDGGHMAMRDATADNDWRLSQITYQPDGTATIRQILDPATGRQSWEYLVDIEAYIADQRPS